MKIICVDNYDRENRSDKLIAENVNEYYAKLICNKLNVNEESDYFYKAVADDHKLYIFEGY